MGTTVQTSWTAPSDCSLDVTDGGGTVTVSFTTGQIFDNATAVLAYLKEQIEATLGTTWTFTVSSSAVLTISVSAYPFSWDWDTATDLRDYLGYAGNASGQASAWTASSAIEGYYFFDMDAQRWIPEYTGTIRTYTLQTILADGKTEQATTAKGYHRTGRITIDLHSDGTFTEHADWEDWLDLVEDGRQFTVYPQDDDTTIYVVGALNPSQQSATITATYPGQWDYWRASIDMLIQEVGGE